MGQQPVDLYVLIRILTYRLVEQGLLLKRGGGIERRLTTAKKKLFIKYAAHRTKWFRNFIEKSLFPNIRLPGI